MAKRIKNNDEPVCANCFELLEDCTCGDEPIEEEETESEEIVEDSISHTATKEMLDSLYGTHDKYLITYAIH